MAKKIHTAENHHKARISAPPRNGALPREGECKNGRWIINEKRFK